MTSESTPPKHPDNSQQEGKSSQYEPGEVVSRLFEVIDQPILAPTELLKMERKHETGPLVLPEDMPESPVVHEDGKVAQESN